MKRLTIEQAIVISGYTKVLCCDFSSLHADIERRLGRPVWTHEIGSKDVQDEIKAAYRGDFLALCADGTPMPDEEAP